MNISEFRRSLLESRLFESSSNQLSVDEYVELFNDEITQALDRHAPLIRRTKRVGRHDNRWLSSKAREAKSLSRRLERQFRRTLSPVDRGCSLLLEGMLLISFSSHGRISCSSESWRPRITQKGCGGQLAVFSIQMTIVVNGMTMNVER